MTEQTQLNNVRGHIKTALTTVQTNQMSNTMHSADYSSTITESVMIHYSDK